VVKKSQTKAQQQQMMDSAIEEIYDDGLNEIEAFT